MVFLCDCRWHVMSMTEYCFSHFDTIWPLPTYLIKRWAGFTVIEIVILGNICRTFRNAVWFLVQFYSSNMSSPVQFQLQSGYQVLPPRRRWDLCAAKLHELGRKAWNFKFVGECRWRCRAEKFLLGLWQDFEMPVGSGRSTLGSEIEKNWRGFHNLR